MKLLLYIFSICSATMFAPNHEVAIAMYSISEIENKLVLRIQLDAEDFYGASTMSEESMTLKTLYDYLDENLHFRFNEKEAAFSLVDFNRHRDHIRINASFDSSFQEIKTIIVENTCLIGIPNHSNIIQIDLNDQTKDFRMHKGRTEISLSY